MSFAFNIPFKVERGENMETIIADVNCSTSGEVWNWLERVLGITDPSSGIWYVARRSPVNDLTPSSNLLGAYKYTTTQIGGGFKTYTDSSVIISGTPNEGSTSAMRVFAGDEYIVFRI